LIIFAVSRLPPTLLGFHHFTREAWFPNDAINYKLCSELNGEDPNCSKGVLIPNSITDHLTYKDNDLRDGFGSNNCGKYI
jgi:hypothetical protein